MAHDEVLADRLGERLSDRALSDAAIKHPEALARRRVQLRAFAVIRSKEGGRLCLHPVNQMRQA